MLSLAVSGWLVFGDAATAVAALAALATVLVTVQYGRRTAGELRDVSEATRDTADRIQGVVQQLGSEVDSTREATRQMSIIAKELGRLRDQARSERVLGDYVDIGRLVQDIFFASDTSTNRGYGDTDWMIFRNRLSVMMVPYVAALPTCADVLNSNSRPDALGKAGRAGPEIQQAIQNLELS